MSDLQPIPAAVVRALNMNWGVLVDAYLADAAKVGDRFAATLFFDHSGVIGDGQTVVTPPLRKLTQREDFHLMQSECGRDHYIIVSKYRSSNIRAE